MPESVLTLIAAPDKEKLTPGLAQSIGTELAARGASILGTEWLAEGIACDIFFTRIGPDFADMVVRDALARLTVDAVCQTVAERRKRLLISDMDSTIITIECIDEIADFAGVKSDVAAITERAMKGEIDFVSALAARVGLLQELPEETLQRVYDERVRFMPGARELVATMRANGAHTMLVSGGFDFFTSRVREALGFHTDSANRLEIAEGALTGRVLPPILDRQAKLASLQDACAAKAIAPEEALAVGDGANDVPMLVAAGLGVAYHAKPIVQQSARARINHADLTALLYAQGYHRDEIVNDWKK